MLFFQKRKRYFFEYEHDMHSHVLPALDDGVKTLDEAVMIVRRLEKLGLKRLTCTPHVAYPGMLNTREDIKSMFTVLKSRLAEEGVSIRLDVAAEYRAGGFMLGLVDQNEVLASPEGEVLLEHSFMAPSVYTDDILFCLQGKGLCPVLAHPERYLFYAGDVIGHCRQFKEKGGKLQVNLLSFTGLYGKEAMRGARLLYDSGLVDYYAGDIHNLQHEMLLEKLIGGAFS